MVAFAGETLPIAVRVEGDPSRVPTVTLDGVTLGAQLVWIEAERIGGPGWIGPARRLFVGDGPGDGRVGAWYLLVDLPESAAQHTPLNIGDRRVELVWPLDPRSVDFGPAPFGQRGPLDSPLPDDWRVRPSLANEVQTLLADPLRAWRAELAFGRMATGERTVFGDAALDAIAEHERLSWASVLTLVHGVDFRLAEELSTRLAGAVDFGSGVVAPVWTADERALAELKRAVLVDQPNSRGLVRAVRAWLDARPRGAVWVIDDAGASDAAGNRLLPTLGVVTLRAAARPAVLTAIGSEPVPELEPLLTRRARAVRAPIDPPVARVGAAPPTPPTVAIGVDDWTAVRSVAAVEVPAAPPGFVVGPGLRDWTLATWAGEGGEVSSALAAPERAFVAVVRRGYEADEPSRRAWWRVYVECAEPEGTRAEAVTIYAGAFGAPEAVLRVTRDGSVTDLASPVAPARAVDTSERPGVWTFELRLPSSAIGRDGVLRLGVVREDVDGVRTAWPRAMLPWQTEPGRAAIDTEMWEGYPTR